jgi:hypothetical protein
MRTPSEKPLTASEAAAALEVAVFALLGEMMAWWPTHPWHTWAVSREHEADVRRVEMRRRVVGPDPSADTTGSAEVYDG